ncbi:MAG: chromate resistance protein ChrB domain-containing protein [Parvibaculum sp.]|uniref:chromate resistance protein ChrB domain-containing protein n=1 Tax=Parvibaculum sp. TaxID=2024848 RepID=UPI0034A0000D
MSQTKSEDRLSILCGTRRPTLWVTREHQKIDRIACPWLIRRFVDPTAEILFAPTGHVMEVAARKQAVAFDIPGAPLTHVGDRCSFDAFLDAFGLDDPGLQTLAPIVRGADTDRHELAPESAGLHAVSMGLSLLYADDHALLTQGLIVYDALYAWANHARGQHHDWRPVEM